MKKVKVAVLYMIFFATLSMPSTAFAADREMGEMETRAVMEFAGGTSGGGVKILRSEIVDIKDYDGYLNSTPMIEVSATLDGITDRNCCCPEGMYQNEEGKAENIAVIKGDSTHSWSEKSGIIFYGSSTGEWGIRSVNLLEGMAATEQEPETMETEPMPGTPLSLEAYKTAEKVVTLNWEKATFASGYEIYLKKGSGDYKKIKTIKGAENTQYRIKNLYSAASYKLRVRSYLNRNGANVYSDYTKVVMVNMKKQPLPQNLTLSKSMSIKVGEKKN